MRKRDWKKHKYLWSMVLLGILCGGIGIVERVLNHQSEEIQVLERNCVGQGEKEIILSLEAENLSEGYSYPITIKEQQLTEKEVQQLFRQAEEELEEVILGENLSPMEISQDLFLPKELQEGMVSVSCYFEPYEIIDAQGAIQWENVTQDTSLVKVRAEMSCQEYEAVHEFYLQLMQKQLNEQEILLKEIKEKLAAENEKQGKSYIQLPKELNGVKLHWKKATESTALRILVLGMTCIISLYVYNTEKRKGREKKRQWELTRDYPDIVSQLSLLTGAGMTVAAAWMKISMEYTEQKECGRIGFRPGYEEMKKAWHEMQDGTGEIKAYENFGARCGQPQYRKFVSILTQNVRKGTTDMQRLLDAEAREAFMLRKTSAKQLGEEAGTKLLLPMGIMLVLVFVILLLPAMLKMQL